MSMCDYRGSLVGTSGEIMYEYKTDILQTTCKCNITGVSESTIREYIPYYNSSCIDGFLEVNEKSFNCTGNNLWKNNIFNRGVKLAGTLKVNLNLHDGRGPKRLWIYIKGRLLARSLELCDKLTVKVKFTTGIQIYNLQFLLLIGQVFFTKIALT